MEFEKIRKKIEEIDNKLIDLIKERLSLMPEVAEYKLKNDLPVNDPAREKEIIMSGRKKAEEIGISPDLVEKIYLGLIEESCRIQEKAMAGKNEE